MMAPGVGHIPKTDPLADALLLVRSRGYTIVDKGLDATESSSSGVGGLHTSGAPQTRVYQQPMFPNPVGSFGQCIMPTYHMDSGMESFMPVRVCCWVGISVCGGSYDDADDDEEEDVG